MKKKIYKLKKIKDPLKIHICIMEFLRSSSDALRGPKDKTAIYAST